MGIKQSEEEWLLRAFALAEIRRVITLISAIRTFVLVGEKCHKLKKCRGHPLVGVRLVYKGKA